MQRGSTASHKLTFLLLVTMPAAKPPLDGATEPSLFAQARTEFWQSFVVDALAVEAEPEQPGGGNAATQESAAPELAEGLAAALSVDAGAWEPGDEAPEGDAGDELDAGVAEEGDAGDAGDAGEPDAGEDAGEADAGEADAGESESLLERVEPVVDAKYYPPLPKSWADIYVQEFGTGIGIGERSGTRGFGTGIGIGERDGTQGFGTGFNIGERGGIQGFGTGFDLGSDNSYYDGWGTGLGLGEREGSSDLEIKFDLGGENSFFDDFGTGGAIGPGSTGLGSKPASHAADAGAP